jgi:hypothetical protein
VIQVSIFLCVAGLFEHRANEAVGRLAIEVPFCLLRVAVSRLALVSFLSMTEGVIASCSSTVEGIIYLFFIQCATRARNISDPT